MDQDAFRNLLEGSRQIQPKQVASPAAQKAVPSQPAFRPRKVKKAEGKYRDRAAERREGVGNDYAQVEAVLEDFQKRVAHEDKDVIEQQRKYLGGDSQHTVLVKGLDMSLLEQNRARVAASTGDDDILEEAFAEAASTVKSTESRKRTREDIIRDLKANRQNGDGSFDQPVVEKSVKDDGSTLETTKKAGKFRPIGFRPIGQMEEKSKKRKVKEGKEGARKKKQKVENVPVQSGIENDRTPRISQQRDITEAAPSSSKAPKKPPEAEPVTLDEDFDIFAGAGDYEGFPDDESEEEDTRAVSTGQEVTCVPLDGAKSWFDEPKAEVRRASIPPEETPPIPETSVREEDLGLKPLESSALPSIRDFLAMSDAAEKAGKRKARKEKKKKKKAGDDDDD